MSDGSRLTNAFSEEYQALLRERDEPDGPWAGDAAKPVVIWKMRNGFGLFRPWQDPQSGDEPLAVFTDLADARLAVVARSIIRRTRYYQLREPQYPHPVEGYAVLREGEEKGRLRIFEPEWIDVMNMLTCTAQTAEGLAVVLDLSGPTTQEELGELLGRSVALPLHPDLGGEAGEEETHPEPVRPTPPDPKGDQAD
ncbi:MAG: hypothetical protein QOF89_169 [Acidobacteriota bacterium]|nr:hypothetical protein [Acidobacteriota bacterium]